VVVPVCRPEPRSLAASTPDDVLVAAREAGASLVLIGKIHKVSTLVSLGRLTAWTTDPRLQKFAASPEWFDKLRRQTLLKDKNSHRYGLPHGGGAMLLISAAMNRSACARPRRRRRET
jgi:hypothetical protein